ncbi:biotin attachment protein [Mesorhizobium sp. M7A.F.Ca.US.011.01.1.1]|uniref:biotin attachment protein n=1 Tax=Mesorhizobium sp. M7A.F.Ca.US.011.01.1.1 TaxID=2496741 RepID=UPI000FC9C115|nr:biotin attachment protein [Mesorhizobium sp. M7A.F.Ca.US.011.01.1.1]RUX30208.1 biotin attachment protein [Mesorhizobium sp. M7A.F.Ca.US.011.01.1.1]
MTIEEIERLAAWCASAGMGEIELSDAGFSLRLHMQSVVASNPAEAPKAETVFKGVRAPGVGVFRLDHPTTGHPVVGLGQAVRKGETVGVLQIGPCLKAVVAPADGVLGTALAEDGAVVGYGTPLYELV